MKKLNVRTSGVSSRVSRTSLHVVFLDYDNIDDERLREELAFLQNKFEIGNFYVLETRNEGRHVVCIARDLNLSAIEYRLFSSILLYTSVARLWTTALFDFKTLF